MYQDYETPEQYESRTGKEWPDSNAVYGCAEYSRSDFFVTSYGDFKKQYEFYNKFSGALYFCVVATDAGCPPLGWRPDK